MLESFYPDYLILIIILAAIFTYFLFRKSRTQNLEKLSDQSQFLKCGSHNIHYMQLGNGKINLVFFHGIGANVYTWRKLVPLLSDNFKITLVDLPGFGKSTKDKNLDYDLDTQAKTLDQFIELLNLDNVVLVGSSMGGSIALWMAKLFPDKYEKVIAMSPATNPKLSKGVHLAPFRVFSRIAHKILNKTVVEKIMKQLYYDISIIEAEDVRNYYAPYQDSPEAVKCFIKAFEIIRDKRLPDALNKLNCKTLLLWGEYDKLTPLRFGEELNRVIQNSELYINEFAGHHLMEEYPKWCAQHIIDFIP